METENYFVHNRETDRLELHFDKMAYRALDKAQQKKIKAYFLFSRTADAWVSKAKISVSGGWQAKDIATKLGLKDEGATGEAMGFLDAQQDRLLKAKRLADSDPQGRAEARYNSAEKEFTRRDDAINERYPSPWVTGRSGYPAHRLRKRSQLFESNMEKFRAAQLRYERESSVNSARLLKQIKSPEYLNNRLEEALAEQRRAERENNDEAWQEAEIKVTYYEEKIAEIGGIQFSKESLKRDGVTHIIYRGKAYPIVRFNDKTVSVGRWLIAKDTSTWSVPYAEIQGVGTNWDDAILPKPGEKKASVKLPFKKGDVVLYKMSHETRYKIGTIYSIGPKFVRFRKEGTEYRHESIFPVTTEAKLRLEQYAESLREYVKSDPARFLAYLISPGSNPYQLNQMTASGPYKGHSERGYMDLINSDLSVMGYIDLVDFYRRRILNETPAESTGAESTGPQPSARAKALAIALAEQKILAYQLKFL